MQVLYVKYRHLRNCIAISIYRQPYTQSSAPATGLHCLLPLPRDGKARRGSPVCLTRIGGADRAGQPVFIDRVEQQQQEPNMTTAFDHRKYRPTEAPQLANRQWPSRSITKAPIWASVDLRDGNQALIEPMNPQQKKRMWALLVKIGLKEIEVGFPSASQTDYDFVRWAIEEKQIPEDVTIQVLVQARQDLIKRTYEAVKGARRVIVHVYNST